MHDIINGTDASSKKHRPEVEKAPEPEVFVPEVEAATPPEVRARRAEMGGKRGREEKEQDLVQNYGAAVNCVFESKLALVDAKKAVGEAKGAAKGTH